MDEGLFTSLLMGDSPQEDCLKESIKLDDEEKQNLVGKKKKDVVSKTYSPVLGSSPSNVFIAHHPLLLKRQ